MRDCEAAYIRKLRAAQLRAIRAGRTVLAEYFGRMVRKLKERSDA